MRHLPNRILILTLSKITSLLNKRITWNVKQKRDLSSETTQRMAIGTSLVAFVAQRGCCQPAKRVHRGEQLPIVSWRNRIEPNPVNYRKQKVVEVPFSKSGAPTSIAPLFPRAGPAARRYRSSPSSSTCSSFSIISYDHNQSN